MESRFPVATLPDDSTLAELLDFARRLATLAESEIMPRFEDCAVKFKPDGTEVTDADHRAEEVIRTEIERVYPGHRILGEEFGETTPRDSAPCWVIDPIDGTAAFTLGLPTFGTLVAWMVGDDPVLGVIHMPALGETTYAARGLGCWRHVRGESEPTRVRAATPVPLHEAVGSATGLHGTDLQSREGRTIARLSNLVGRVRKFRFVGDCLQHAMVCRGRLHFALDIFIAPWDVAALIPCIEEAGGIATDLQGSRAGLVFANSFLSSCDRSLHDEILGALRWPADRSGLPAT